MEVRIELGRDDRNINPYFEPLGLARRGKWRRANIPAVQQQDYGTLPDLPGYMIACDIDEGTVRYYDPLRGSRRQAEIEKAFTQFFRRPLAIEPEFTANVGKSGVRRHLLAMYILCEAGNAELVDGKWPDWLVKQRDKERDEDAKRAGWDEHKIAAAKEAPAELVQTSE